MDKKQLIKFKKRILSMELHSGVRQGHLRKHYNKQLNILRNGSFYVGGAEPPAQTSDLLSELIEQMVDEKTLDRDKTYVSYPLLILKRGDEPEETHQRCMCIVKFGSDAEHVEAVPEGQTD